MVAFWRSRIQIFSIGFAVKDTIFDCINCSFQSEAAFADIEGNVLVNSGTGYRVPPTAILKAGDRIMVGSKVAATILFDDGCTVPAINAKVNAVQRAPRIQRRAAWLPVNLNFGV
jgi:hypothetical protein